MNAISEIPEVSFILNRIDILKDIEPEAIRDIASSVELDSFNIGEKLISRAQQGERMYMIFSGEVEVLIPDVIRGNDKKSHSTGVRSLVKYLFLPKKPIRPMLLLQRIPRYCL